MKKSGRLNADASSLVALRTKTSSRIDSALRADPGSRPHRIALLIETSLASGRDMLAGIARFNREYGGWSLYHQPRGLEEMPFETLGSWQGDGIIARIQSKAWLRELRSKRVPVVDLLGVLHATNIPRVIPDNHAIARLAFDHFVERGFRHFGFFGIQNEEWSARREVAFRQAVAESRGTLSSLMTPRHEPQLSLDEHVQRLSTWLLGLPKPVGVFICSDQRGPETLEACNRAKLRIPDEVALLGVDNDEPLCQINQPSLSSVCPNHDQIGYEAARLLKGWLDGKTPASETLLSPRTIVIRQSTDILSVSDGSVVKALRFIHEQSHRSITLDDVARAAALSRSVLQRRFRSILNVTVLDEILKTRIKKAQGLLTETNLSLAEIAERSGFNHQEYLGYVFKQRLNDTPAAYRARAKGFRR